MFGESDSESPRVPSPWDSLISTPPSPATHPVACHSAIPKLVPEAEEGNVEYKLQLLSPSPARFERLVTQLKWRLLEGGGQAYYELGVADSGALIGLRRPGLEQSLETLEMMAGEIGASVIVVKEIEVPAAMAGLAGSQTDQWNGKRMRKKAAMLGLSASEGDTTTTTTVAEFDTELSTDMDDYESSRDHHRPIRIRPATSNLSGSAHIKDPDSETDPAENADAESEPEYDPTSPLSLPSQFSIDLEIASVFKPRPMRRRLLHNGTLPPVKQKQKRERGPKKPKQRHLAYTRNQGDADDNKDGYRMQSDRGQESPSCTSDVEEEKPYIKSSNRRQARDRRREEKRKALLAYATYTSATVEEQTARAGPDSQASPIRAENGEGKNILGTTVQPLVLPDQSEAAELVADLSSLHVSLESPTVPSIPFVGPGLEITESPIPGISFSVEGDDDDGDVFASPSPFTHTPAFSSSNVAGLSPFSTLMFTKTHATGTEDSLYEPLTDAPRLIVEALVVRKMSLEEAFLDFGGFSLK